MRVLEARFYPERKTKADFIVVGSLVWNDRRPHDRPQVQPASNATSAPLLSKLLYLLNLTTPDSFDQLQSLRSEFWSFVEIGEEATHRSASGDARSR
jgi:hypothetical protein